MSNFESNNIKKRINCYLGEKCPAWEYCKGKIDKCCADILEDYFRKQGNIVFRSGRSVMLVKQEKYKNVYGIEYDVLKIEVHGDPDSGMYGVDEVIISGSRGGCYNILLNDESIYSVFDNLGCEHSVVVNLYEVWSKIFIELCYANDEYKRKKYEEAKWLIKRLAEIIKLTFRDERIKNSYKLHQLINLDKF